MNREQMVSLLIMDGWVPNNSNEHWWMGCCRDGLDVYYDADQGGVRRMRIDKPRDRPVCSWDDLPTFVISKLYTYIQEKDHGKLE